MVRCGVVNRRRSQRNLLTLTSRCLHINHNRLTPTTSYLLPLTSYFLQLQVIISAIHEEFLQSHPSHKAWTN
jgi:hypothetical protein